MAAAVIHITVDLEAVLRQKLRELAARGAASEVSSSKLYLSGYRAALEWVLEEAGINLSTRR